MRILQLSRFLEPHAIGTTLLVFRVLPVSSQESIVTTNGSCIRLGEGVRLMSRRNPTPPPPQPPTPIRKYGCHNEQDKVLV